MIGARTTLASVRVRGRAFVRVFVGALVGVLGVTASGCAEPAADVVAMWVDGVADEAGNRRLRIYEAGERDSLSIVPDIPGAGIDLLQMGVDARARGVAVSATDATVWLQRGSGRRVTLNAAAVGRREQLGPDFSFTHGGDGILRALAVDAALPPAWLFAPLSGPASLRVHLVGPPTVAVEDHRWVLHHAAEAPVLVWAETGGSPSAVDGRVLALAYPSDQGQGPVVDDMRPLARGTLLGVGADPEDGRYLTGCPDGLCISPSGRMLYAMAEERACDLARWSWVGAGWSDADTPSVEVALPCPAGVEEARLVAVLDDALVVLDDGLRLHLFDVGAEVGGAVEPAPEVDGDVALDEPSVPPLSSLPKPAGRLERHLAAHGHVLVVSSQRGEVVRVDAEGARLVSGVQSACVVRDGFAVSPGGAWVVQTCNGEASDSGLGGQIQRISVLGAELYTGLPMLPIAIDDEGNALLYSVSADDEDGVPRGLFVLTGDGQLTRVDELEPYPGRVMVDGRYGEKVPGRFAAGGPS